MTFTATPEPSNVPPRVLLEVDADEAGASFTSLTITRNGDPILQQPPLGDETAETYDYLAPFGQSVEYIADGEFLPFQAPDWTEVWASLASWTGDTGSFALGAGDTVTSSTANATITRTASGTIQRVHVTDPDYVEIQVVTAGDVLVASLAVTTNAVLTGTSSAAVAGTGTFELNLFQGTVTATGTGWSVSRPYTGTPTKVRVKSLGGSFSFTSEWTSTGNADQIAVAPGGNIYVLDIANKLVRKYNSSGVAQTTWSTTGTPTDLTVDSAEQIYVLDNTSNLVRKYNSSGTAGITWSTTGDPLGIGRDASDNIYVYDNTNALVRKYTSTGTAGITWAVDPNTQRLDVNPTAAVVVVAWGDGDDGGIERYTTTGGAPGTGSASFSTGEDDPVAVAVNDAGTIFIAQGSRVDSYTPSGVEGPTTSIAPNVVGGAHVTSAGTLLLGDKTAKTVKSYGPTTATSGTIVQTGLAAVVPYREVVSTNMTIDEAWLLHPSSPSLSVSIDPGPNQWRDDGLNVAIESAQSTVAKSVQTLHYPIGRARAVAIGHGNRLDDEWALVLTAPRLEDRDAVSAIVRDQTPLLVRSPPDFGWDLADGFYAVGDVTTDRYFAPLGFEERRITLPLTPSDPPVVRQEGLRTYADLLLEATTYSDIIALYDTYTDLLTGAS